MSLESDLEKNSRQRSHTVTSDDSWLRKEKDDSEVQCTVISSLSHSEAAFHLHAQEDFPDGGLRAWLVVLGVRLWL